MPDEFDEPENMDEPPPFFPYESGDTERRPNSLGELVEVQIEGVFGAESNGQTSRFVLVSDGMRKLPIMIGPFEAQAIFLVLDNSRPDRPMTHDLIRNILERLDVTLDRVVIDDFWNGIYYAKLYIRHGDKELEIDSRPSDAIALAVRFEAPVLVAEGILETGMDE